MAQGDVIDKLGNASASGSAGGFSSSGGGQVESWIIPGQTEFEGRQIVIDKIYIDGVYVEPTKQNGIALKAGSKIELIGNGLENFSAVGFSLAADGVMLKAITRKERQDSGKISFVVPNLDNFVAEGRTVRINLISAVYPKLLRVIYPSGIYSAKDKDESEENKKNKTKAQRDAEELNKQQQDPQVFSQLIDSTIGGPAEAFIGGASGGGKPVANTNQNTTRSVRSQSTTNNQDDSSEIDDNDNTEALVEESGSSKIALPETITQASSLVGEYIDKNPETVVDSSVRREILTALGSGKLENLSSGSRQVLQQVIQTANSSGTSKVSAQLKQAFNIVVNQTTSLSAGVSVSGENEIKNPNTQPNNLSQSAAGQATINLKQSFEILGEHLSKNPELIVNVKSRENILNALSGGNLNSLNNQDKAELQKFSAAVKNNPQSSKNLAGAASQTNNSLAGNGPEPKTATFGQKQESEDEGNKALVEGEAGENAQAMGPKKELAGLENPDESFLENTENPAENQRPNLNQTNTGEPNDKKNIDGLNHRPEDAKLLENLHRNDARIQSLGLTNPINAVKKDSEIKSLKTATKPQTGSFSGDKPQNAKSDANLNSVDSVNNQKSNTQTETGKDLGEKLDPQQLAKPEQDLKDSEESSEPERLQNNLQNRDQDKDQNEQNKEDENKDELADKNEDANPNQDNDESAQSPDGSEGPKNLQENVPIDPAVLDSEIKVIVTEVNLVLNEFLMGWVLAAWVSIIGIPFGALAGDVIWMAKPILNRTIVKILTPFLKTEALKNESKKIIEQININFLVKVNIILMNIATAILIAGTILFFIVILKVICSPVQYVSGLPSVTDMQDICNSINNIPNGGTANVQNFVVPTPK
jgi:hypothetical protein